MYPDAEGIEYPPVAFAVAPSRVRAFADVFGQAEGVPPTFPAVAEFTVLPDVFGDARLGLDFSRVVHGTQDYVYERPIREGEDLMIHARIEAVRVRAGIGFLTVVIELREPGGVLVVTARSTLIERAADA